MTHVQGLTSLYIISKCRKTELIGYWSQIYKLSSHSSPPLVISFCRLGEKNIPNPWSWPKVNSTVDAFPAIWKPHSNLRTIFPIGKNTEEPQMVQEHTTGPSFNILVLPHWVLFPSNNAAKNLETPALGRRLLLSASYSGQLVFWVSFFFFSLIQLSHNICGPKVSYFNFNFGYL